MVLCLAIACGSSSTKAPVASSAPEVRIDRRVELMSILQRLAGAREYMGTPSSAYVTAVDTHFAAHREHAAVVATRQLRASHGISYDAPMWLAVQLDDRLALKARPGDARWDTVDIEGYLASVRRFVADSGFDAFVATHEPYFKKVEDRLRAAIATENPTSWFERFFGARPGARFVVVPGLLAGTRNFGPHTETELYQILGITHLDFDELPVVDAPTIELLVHEMAHGYINPLFSKHAAALAPHGERLFAKVAEPMRKQAYPTWQIMLNEQAVRAVTVLYLRERKGAAAADAALAREVARAFLWTRPLADLLATYAANRQQYSDLDAFMPKLVALFAEST